MWARCFTEASAHALVEKARQGKARETRPIWLMWGVRCLPKKVDLGLEAEGPLYYVPLADMVGNQFFGGWKELWGGGYYTDTFFHGTPFGTFV